MTDTKENLRDRDSKDSKEKLKALQLTIEKLEKTYGKGAVMKLSDERVIDIPAISTGSLGLDVALGIGGIPAAALPRSTGRNLLVKPRSQWPLHRRSTENAVVSLHSSMRNTPSINLMPKSWVSIRKTC